MARNTPPAETKWSDLPSFSLESAHWIVISTVKHFQMLEQGLQLRLHTVHFRPDVLHRELKKIQPSNALGWVSSLSSFFSSYHHTIFGFCESWGHPVLGKKANLPVHPAKKNKRLKIKKQKLRART